MVQSLLTLLCCCCCCCCCCIGLLTIRTEQFTQEGESVVNKQMQKIERGMIALLTKRRWMEGATLVIGGVGIMLGGLAAAHI